MSKIVDFNTKKKELSLSKEDLLNLYLLYENKCDGFVAIDLDVFERSIAIHKKNNQFAFLLDNFEIEHSDDNEEFVNFHDVVNKNEIILLGNTILLLDDEYLKHFEKRYDFFIKIYGNLLFYIHNDLKYGINNWVIVFEHKLNKH